MQPRTDLLRHLAREPRTLADLVHLTGASLPTLRRALADLERERLVGVVGREPSRGGRPAQRFGLDPGGALVLGVHLVHPGMRMVAATLTGERLAEHVPELGDLAPGDVATEVARYADAVRARFPDRPLLGVGVATPGFVDPDGGHILSIGRAPGWTHVPLAERLAAATGVRVTLHNDMDALASSDAAATDPDGSLVYVGFGEGLKFALMFDGVPYAGPFGNAGLAPDALLARLGRGDDAALLRVPGLVAAVDGRAAVEGRPRHATRARFDAVLDAYAAGDPDVAPVVGRMIEVLGAETAAVVHLLQPATLVFGAALAGAPAPVADALERTVRASLPPLLDHALHVRPARLVGPASTAVGATHAFVTRYVAQDVPAAGVPT
ncbi:MAG: ROK family transcriptional regulator [Trueperaceae bacterium]|nr:ROK family transcriptional regulator [Trueperaceae bacterium]